MSLKRDLALVSVPSDIFLLNIAIFFSSFFFFFNFFISPLLTWDCHVILVQITQEVFVAKEWVKEAQNDVKNEVHRCFKAEKALGAAKEENTELLSKLAIEERKKECLGRAEERRDSS